ncbi:MAG: c-type cytochrome, partial [Massilia sp.]
MITTRILWAGVMAAGLFAGGARAETGRQIYSANCAACHGASREGGMGPSLIDAKFTNSEAGKSKSKIAGIVKNGIPRTQMPAWGAKLSAAQIGLVADYLLERKEPGAAGGDKKTAAERYPELANFKLPKGFHIAVYSDAVPNARAMAISDSGIVFVGSRNVGKIYALVDADQDHVIKKVVTVAEGLDSPIGLVMHKGSLFVSEMTRVIRFDDIEKTFDKAPGYKVVKSDFPKEKWHGEKIIKAGPDGKLYIPIGADCNVCDREEDAHSKIYRMNPDGSQFEVFAKGIRNSVGFAWDPRTSEMWFTDNNRDEMGDNLPSCELNHAPKAGMHFGFPYCHAGMLPDPVFGKNRSCEEFTPPAALLGPHTAPLGLNFYTGS